MRRFFWLPLAAFCVAAAPPANDVSKKDLQKLQGDWAAVSMVVDGVVSSDDEAQSLFRTVKGNAYTLFFFKKAFVRYTFTIDATKQPRTIDAKTVPSSPQAKPLLGIYKFDGGRWVTCFAAPGKERPKDFTSKPDSGNQLSVWEREKP